MIIVLIAIAALALLIFLFFKQRVFGKLPSGARLDRILKSPNYKDGSFQNLNPTPQLAQGESMFKVMMKFLFGKKVRNKPAVKMPSEKTDLKSIPRDENVLVWFGHSSYFMQIEGTKILVDPVLSGSASPIEMTTKSFLGSDIYAPEDLPEIDYLFITHDHFDHLDFKTVVALRHKVRKVVTGLGSGAHLEHWGYDPEDILEMDWHETADLGDGFKVTLAPARHFSGRTFKRNTALWTSFVLQTAVRRIFLGGDSGYDAHFADIGNQYGPFDLAILECGQYNQSWKYIHMLPDEIVPAAKDLKTKVLMPVHWGKFALAFHAWDEPINRISKFAAEANLPLLTPMIGQKANLDAMTQNDLWWTHLD